MGKAWIHEDVFGRARVRLSGEVGLVLEELSLAIDALDLTGRPPVDVIAAFRLASVDPDGEGSATLVVAVEGDARLILALVWVDHGLSIVPSDDERDGFAVFTLDEVAVGTLVRIVECETEADAVAWREPWGGPPAGEEGWTRAKPPLHGGGAMGAERGPVGEVSFEPGTGDRAAPHLERSRAMPGHPAPVRRANRAPQPKPPPAWRAEAGPPPVPANGDGRAAESVPAHVSGEMPGVCVAGQIAIVEATLSRDRVTPAAGAAFAEEAVPVIEDKPVLVSIATRGYRLVARTRRVRSLCLKPGRAKDVVRFAVEAVDPGAAEVTLVFRQNGEFPLATLRLVSQISVGPTADQPVKRSVDIALPEADILSMPTLRIDESFAAGESYLDVAVQIGRDHVQGRQKIVNKRQVISETYSAITKLRLARKQTMEDVATRRRRALEELRSIGVSLSLRLFQREVRQFLWDHIDDLDHLVIQTTGEFDIPWEIIYVSDPTLSVQEEPEVVLAHFLGMRGSTRWVYNAALPRKVAVRRGHARYLCPSYTGAGLALAFTREEAQLVRGALHASVVRPGTAAAMSKLMTDGFDLLHFAGHGVWSTTPPDQRLLLARFRNSRPEAGDTAYSATTLRHDLPDRGDSAAADSAAMVFLNACDVGRTDASTAGLGGFPEAFLRGGVGILLGCSWAIDDEIGGTFSRHFYEAIKTSDIGDAMRTARTRSLDDDNDDLSALAYVAYAHPHARVTMA